MRVPPQNLEAEGSVLGGLMLDSTALDRVLEYIKEDDFYKNANKKIFSAILELNRNNNPIDLISLSSFLKDKSELDAIGGAAYLATLLDFTPSAAHIEYYSKLVSQKSVLRKLLGACTGISEQIYGQDITDSLDDFLNQSEATIFSIAEKIQSKGPIPVMEAIKGSLDHIESLYKRKMDITGVPSGYIDLDRLTCGFQPSDMIVVAARPGVGKTSFCMNIAQHATIREKKSVVVFSMEMAQTQIMMRLLSSEAKIPLSNLRSGRVADSDWPKLISTADKLSNTKLFIDDGSGQSPYEIRAKCRRLKAKDGLDLVILDYLGLMDLKGKKTENKHLEVAEISKEMKALAKELNIPVIVLSQLNREVDKRPDKRPFLSDLRDSGSIEQDADLVLLLSREEYYNKDNPENKGQVEVDVAKHRNGPTGIVKLAWLPQYCTFANLQPGTTN